MTASLVNLDICASLYDLANLPRGVPCEDKVLMCRVEWVCAPRAREFHAGRVFNVCGRLLDGDLGASSSNNNNDNNSDGAAHVYFHDEWAAAAAFVEAGDVVVLEGLVVQNAPPGAAFNFFATPIPQVSTLRVLQNNLQGDIMEVMVRADALDVPSVRVLPKTLLAPFVSSDVNKRSALPQRDAIKREGEKDREKGKNVANPHALD
ncbi:uncharacterized protein TM35_000241180 [Trypanosoma theileri]|uniref:Uncharacterized protein n=1 Tax=Trypanosoma theileri TaxID=67003 RepID=A0A1X0NR08_9TRYP|nr:uncharacterized protein TM35_000241180 [Trypanosoma theileri]ORC86968.1 hypothetical protein TM35_000241180 [Trypanosoma theileri]